MISRRRPWAGGDQNRLDKSGGRPTGLQLMSLLSQVYQNLDQDVLAGRGLQADQDSGMGGEAGTQAMGGDSAVSGCTAVPGWPGWCSECCRNMGRCRLIPLESGLIVQC